MWKLQFPDGTVFRDGFPSQWEATISSTKEDGSRYKKSEALLLPSGSIVWKNRFVSVQEPYNILCRDGSIGGTYLRSLSVPYRQKFILVEY